MSCNALLNRTHDLSIHGLLTDVLLARIICNESCMKSWTLYPLVDHLLPHNQQLLSLPALGSASGKGGALHPDEGLEKIAGLCTHLFST